jgi:hypothetical protein
MRNQCARLAADIDFSGERKTLWFECDAAHADKFSVETCDGFLLSILAAAMREGKDIIVEGPLSNRLYYNVKLYYLELLHNLIPDTKKISIEARNLIKRNWGGTGVYAGFSAGVDSFCTIADHSAPNVSPEYQISQLLFNNVGSHGQSDHDLKIFQDRFARQKLHAQAMNLPLFSVNSNLDEVTNIDFQLTHTLRNTAVALLFQKSCGKFLYSSAVHYRDSFVKPTSHIEFGDAIGVPLLSTETTECISSGSQHTRVEKIKIISSVELTHKALDVCVDPAHASKVNCSKCWKCLRTELTLEVLGTLDHYKGAFDLDVYNKFRWLYLCHVLGSKEPLIREIREEMANRNFEIPVSVRMAAQLVPHKIIDMLLLQWQIAGSDNVLKIGWGVAREIAKGLMRRLDLGRIYGRPSAKPGLAAHTVAIPFTGINGGIALADINEKRAA